MKAYTINPEIVFRPYRRTDLLACTSIAVEVFSLVSSRFTREDTSRLMKILIDGCHVISNYHELAVADGKVVGLIFGRVERKFVLIDMCQRLERALSILVRFLLGTYGSRRKLVGLMKPALQAVKALGKNMPLSEAEVVLFAVAPEHQGVGIGCALMGRFVCHAAKYEVEAISVPTNETASFWFYEKYGFRKWAEYKDPLESYLADRPIKGFTYLLLLHKAGGQELIKC
jgi:ribosomal protein S18 acetylase RimI-like enzyme